MPKLDGNGPNPIENEKGRGLGICIEKNGNSSMMGKGMAKRRHQTDGCKGQGKRINYYQTKKTNK